MKKIIIAFALLLLFLYGEAQPFNLKKEIKPVELNLVNFNSKDVKKKGRINLTKVVQVKDTAYYFVKKTSIYSPIVVSVGVANPANPVQVSLHKWNWKVASRPGKQTNEKGYWEETFSTEGDFGIMVVATQLPSEYEIYIWVGNEVKLKVAPPFRQYNASDKKSSVGLFTTNNILIAIAILAAVIFIFFKLKKRAMTKTVGIVILFTVLSITTYAQGGSVSQNRGGSIDFDEIENSNDYMENFGGAIGHAADIAESYGDLRGAWNVLDKGECSPDFSQPASALIPSSCGEFSGCNECYESALESFNADRQTLARMLCLFMNTKNFNDKAIAFGNSMASLPGGVGMGWVPAKKSIDNAFTKFKSTYDTKSRELLESLQKNMIKIDACEKLYGVQDWYQRFGFMYFEFMQQKYKRPE